MIPDIYEPVLDKLSRRTARGEVVWQVSPRGDMLIVKFKEVSLSMTRGANFLHFIIMDADGNPLDEFRVNHTDTSWDMVNALYSRARKRAPGVEKALEAFHRELDAQGVIGLKEGDN
jgi:hypothetical protein